MGGRLRVHASTTAGSGVPRQVVGGLRVRGHKPYSLKPLCVRKLKVCRSHAIVNFDSGFCGGGRGGARVVVHATFWSMRGL